MKVIILGVNTLYINFCLFKQMPMVSKGLIKFAFYFFLLQTVTGIGATGFESYTNATNDIIEYISEIVTNRSSVLRDCCGYRNQILDKFCAVQVER